MDNTGALISHYRIVRRIGRGGMGDVFEAEDETLRRRVALKTIRAENRPTPVAKARFLREARILSRLDHTGICRIHDYVDGEDRDHLVLEYIAGETLTDVENANALDVIEQLLAVLVEAHDADIIHRDLKPDNVMVTADGTVKVLDFGLARHLAPRDPSAATVDLSADAAGQAVAVDPGLTFTNQGGILGTPSFMSPEQASGERATAASDMYSCGLIMHLLLAGESAYGKTRHLPDLLARVRAAKTVPLTGSDGDLADLVGRLTSRAPGARPTAAEARRRLRWIRRKPARRNRRLLAALMVLLVMGGSLKYTLDLRHERREAQLHRAQAEDLLGFMLGDLRAKLTPIGRLDIMDAVGGKAMAYFSGRDPARLSGDDAERYVRTLNLIGQIRLSEGMPKAAEVAFAEALVTAQELVARDPDIAEWQVQLGATYFYLGSVAYGARKLVEAEDRFRDYYRISRALVARDTLNPVWQKELAYAQTTLAQLFKEQDKLDEAMLILDQALVTKAWLVTQNPDALTPIQDLANSQAIYGSIMQDAGKLRGALARFSRARRNLESIAGRDSLNFGYKSRLAVLLQREGRIHELMGHDNKARNLYERDLAIGRELSRHDPANVRWRQELVTSLTTTGGLVAALGDSQLAKLLLAEADLMVAQVPAGVARIRAVRSLRANQARIALGRREYATVLRILPADSSASTVADVGACVLRGQALAHLNRPDAARKAWDRGLALIGTADPATVRLMERNLWAQLYLLTGNRSQAELLIADLYRAEFDHYSSREVFRSHGLATN